MLALFLLLAPAPAQPTLTEGYLVGSWHMLWEDSSLSVVSFKADGAVDGYLLSPQWGFKGAWHFDRGQLYFKAHYHGYGPTWGFRATKVTAYSRDSFTVEQYAPFTETTLTVRFTRTR